MSAKSQKSLAAKLSGLFASGKANHKSRSRQRNASKRFAVEGLEKREMFSVSAVYFAGANRDEMVVTSDNTATNVSVQKIDGNIQIKDQTNNRTWNGGPNISRVWFVGGAGDDRFVNYVR